MAISSEIGTSSDQDASSGQARKLTDDLKEKAGELTGTAVTAAKRQAKQVMHTATSTASEVGEKVTNAMHDQKAAGADYLSGVAGAIHRSADAFTQEVPAAARYIHQAAEQVDTLADAIRDQTPREILEEVQGFARRQPALFFGGALILGFAAFRFLKSAPPESASLQDRS